MSAPDPAGSPSVGADSNGLHRIDQLQSLRGLASLTVVLHHCSLTYQSPDSFRYSMLVFNAHAAVIVFFVLSGYVLQLSLMRGAASLRNALAFLVRRAFRILPVVMIVTTVWLALAPLVRLESTPGTSIWFAGMAPRQGLSGWQLLLCALGLSNALIPPVWTITVELFGSVFMPAFDRVGRWGWQVLWIVTALLAGLAIAHARMGSDSLSAVQNFGPIDYLVYFCAGAALCRTPRSGWRAPLWSLAVLAIGLCGVRVVLIGLRTGHVQFIEYMYGYWLAALAEGVFAVGLIYALTTSGAAGRALSGRALTCLGDISYSVYLLHFPVLTASVWLLGRLAPWNALDPVARTLGLAVIVVATTLFLAGLSYRFIERLGIRAGKAFLERRRLVAVQA